LTGPPVGHSWIWCQTERQDIPTGYSSTTELHTHTHTHKHTHSEY